MKKILIAFIMTLTVFSLLACGEKEKDTLSVFFVPSRDAQYIIDTTAPLEQLLLDELNDMGYNFKEITIEVGTSYEAVGEGMLAGTVDVGFLPGGTYALYSGDGEVDVILAATRAGLNKDSTDPSDWNDGLPTLGDPDNQVTYYRSLIVAGPSATGRLLADKVNNGQALTWDDVNSATWCIQGPTSSAGTVYPSVYLFNTFNKKVSDLDNTVSPGGYGQAVAALAAENCDVATMYADARRDYADAWELPEDDEGYGREESIWTETDVIIVTDGIFNDTISVSNATVDADLKDALAQAFINIIATDAGKDIFEVYAHQGYQRVTDADYEAARIAQQIILGDD